MIYFLNACVREESRTKRLADELLKRLDDEVEEVVLSALSFPVTDEAFLKKRDSLIAKEEWSHPMFEPAVRFAAADTIVIAAPYWDLSFPAVLKQYFEQINVLGVTFRYSPEGTPLPLCKAGRLFYVMTAGGAYVPEEYGFGYIKALAEGFYGIREVHLIKAAGLDIVGADVNGIMNDAIAGIDRLFCK